MPKSIAVFGRRWLDRKTGSTYNSVELWIDNKVTHLPIKRGHGDQYLKRADQYLKEHNIFDAKNIHLALAVQKSGISYTQMVADVKEKDALNGQNGVHRKKDRILSKNDFF